MIIYFIIEELSKHYLQKKHGRADKKPDFHGLRKELDYYVFSEQKLYRITGLSPVRFCN
jgi:hypothetical protein